MARSSRKGVHYKGPIWGDGRAMGGAIRDLPLDIAARTETIYWFNDFLCGEADYDETADWTESMIGTGTGATALITTDTHGGVLTVTAGSANDEGIQTEFTGANGAGEFIVPATDKWFAFGARFKKTTAASGAIFVGLNETLTTTDLIVATDGLLTNVTNGIGFYTGEASAALTLEAKRSSGSKTGSVAVATLAADTYVDVAFRAEVDTISSDTINGRVIPYLKGSDGVWAKVNAGFTTAIPNAGICPAFACKNEPGAVTGILTIDYFWVAIER